MCEASARASLVTCQPMQQIKAVLGGQPMQVNIG
jgi:hypothetical protein